MATDRVFILQEVKDLLMQSQGLDTLNIVHNKLLEIFECQRVTIYTCDERTVELVSIVKTGREVEEIRLPLNWDSIAAGACGLYRLKIAKFLNIANVRDKSLLHAYSTDLRFENSVDNQTGFLTSAMLCFPLVYSNVYLLGVLQLMNPNQNEIFTEEDESFAESVSTSLTLFLKKHVTKAEREDIQIPKNSKDAIKKVFDKHQVGYGAGLAPAIDKIITEWKERGDKLEKYKELLK